MSNYIFWWVGCCVLWVMGGFGDKFLKIEQNGRNQGDCQNHQQQQSQTKNKSSVEMGEWW